MGWGAFAVTMRCWALSGLWLMCATLLASCSTLDLTHPAEVTKWGTGGTALEGAAYLTVYDNELKQLSMLAQAEDASLAQRLVACRNADLAAVLDSPSPEYTLACPPHDARGGEAYFQAILAKRLEDAAGTRSDARTLSGLKLGMDRDDQNTVIGQYLLDNARQDYARDHPAPKRVAAKPQGKGGAASPTPKPFDASCEALAHDDVATLEAAGADVIQMRCKELANLNDLRDAALATFLGIAKLPSCTPTPAGPRLLVAYCIGWRSSATSTQGAADAASDLEVKLQAEVKAATAANTQSEDSLAQFGKELQSDLNQLPNGLAKTSALAQLSEIVDAISRADICNEPKQFDTATVAAAKCDSTSATPVETKASDTWAFLNALAMLADASNSKSRSVQWLAGAQAIIAAQKADAQLQSDQDAANVSAAQEEFRALVVEVTEDAAAQLYLSKMPGHPCGVTPMSCALPLWIDATNRGVIPAAVLAGRADQVAREYAVRRERAVADRRSQLLIAAANAEDAGVKAGIDPAKLTTLFFDLAAIAVVAAK